MEENTTTGIDKQSSLLATATEDEIFVAQILLDLRNMIDIVQSLPGCKWARKKRRSCLDEGAPSSRAPSTQSVQRTDDNVEIEETKENGAVAASPVTPLSFSPSESDEKSKHAFKKCSKKKSREEYIDMIEELSQRRDLLRGEIENVTKYYNKLKAYNSDLKAMRQEVLNSCLKKEESKVEIGREMNLAVEISQHHQIRVAENYEHDFGPISAQFKSSYNGQLPDLNISVEEDPCQPLGTVEDRRAKSAEARRIRRVIRKNKSMRSIKLPARR